MERMRFESFESRFERPQRIEYFNLGSQAVEKELGVPLNELRRFEYTQRSGTESLKSLEVLSHRESGSLFVPPPVTGRPLTIEDLALMTLPVVGFIDKEKPDIVVGCDRGARMYARAVYDMWWRMPNRAGDRFPTMDTRMHFARLSTSLSKDIVALALRDILERSAKASTREGPRGLIGRKFKMMFIDDWISSGATRQHIIDALDSLGILPKIDLRFAVMCGGGADATGRTAKGSLPWNDNPETIGINYTKQGEGYAVITPESRRMIKKLYAATASLTETLKRKKR